MITHHPAQELLFDYASGSLPEAPSLLMAGHLACCALCRNEVHRMEDMGGSLLAGEDCVDMAPDALEAVYDALDAPEPAPAATASSFDAESREVMPGPVRRFVGRNLNDLRWRRVSRNIEEALLPTATPHYRTSLLRAAPGAAVPIHTHGGQEYTLLLQGSLIDDDAVYSRGDVMAANPDHEHRPMAGDEEPCICLIVLDAPLRLTGRFSRLLNPFLRF